MPSTEPVTYDRSALGVGIVHIGVGNFHRAHQARYLDLLARRGLADGWGICGVGALPGDAAVLDTLRSEGCEYTLVEQEPDGVRRLTRVGSIVECLHAPTQRDLVLERLTAPATRIVSLTVTEGGYDPADPAGVFDLVVEGLARRRSAGVPPFTVLSCDNIEENGRVARRCVVAAARRVGPELGDWVDQQVRFPGTMVDRITPATDDPTVIVCESYRRWVVEDDFPLGRPPWEQAGAELIADVRPYEVLKLRLLNGAHQAIAYPGLVAGLTHAHEAVGDPAIVAFASAYMREAATTLEPMPGIDPDQYERDVLARFANAHLPDTLARLAVDGADRITKFVVPVIEARRAAGLPSSRSSAVLAAWARYAELATSGERALPFTDRQERAVAAAVDRLHSSPADFLDQPEWFGHLAGDEVVRAEFVDAYERLASF